MKQRTDHKTLNIRLPVEEYEKLGCIAARVARSRPKQAMIYIEYCLKNHRNIGKEIDGLLYNVQLPNEKITAKIIPFK